MSSHRSCCRHDPFAHRRCRAHDAPLGESSPSTGLAAGLPPVEVVVVLIAPIGDCARALHLIGRLMACLAESGIVARAGAAATREALVDALAPAERVAGGVLTGHSRPAQPARVESHRGQRRRGCPAKARMRCESPRAHTPPPAPLALPRAVLELLCRPALGGRGPRLPGRAGRAGLGRFSPSSSSTASSASSRNIGPSAAVEALQRLLPRRDHRAAR